MNLIPTPYHWRRQRKVVTDRFALYRRERFKCVLGILGAFLLACLFLAVVMWMQPVNLYQ
jgi:hypothetical protein